MAQLLGACLTGWLIFLFIRRSLVRGGTHGAVVSAVGIVGAIIFIVTSLTGLLVVPTDAGYEVNLTCVGMNLFVMGVVYLDGMARLRRRRSGAVGGEAEASAEEEVQDGETYGSARHSGLGIASFTMSVILCVLWFFVLAGGAAAYDAASDGTGEGSLALGLLGLLMIALALLNMLGAALGIAGLAQRNRKKILAMVGLVLNLGGLLLVGTSIILGMLLP